jgi:hypothetical protein
MLELLVAEAIWLSAGLSVCSFIWLAEFDEVKTMMNSKGRKRRLLKSERRARNDSSARL